MLAREYCQNDYLVFTFSPTRYTQFMTLTLNAKDKENINNIVERIEKKKRRDPRASLAQLSFSALFVLLNQEERLVVRKLRELNPKRYGFKGPFLGITQVPKRLVIVRNQRYLRGDKPETLPPQLVPPLVHHHYLNLCTAMRREIGRTILIESGYRSPAYQILVFLFYLRFHGWDLQKTAKRVALPSYSEHGYPPRQALDFMTKDGIPSDDNPLAFARTQEYTWLLKHASDFHFTLSYPKNNRLGVDYEPWHWAFTR